MISVTENKKIKQLDFTIYGVSDIIIAFILRKKKKTTF